MRTPGFWNERGLLSSLLVPLSWCYDMAATLKRLGVKPQSVGVSVICIGGLTAGGAGKTPVALHIGELLKSRGVNAWFLSRGYKGSLHGPLQVTSAHTAREVGDEPLLLSGTLPTVVAKDRLTGAQFAARQGAHVIIMDDGFQNPAIAKNLSLLVIDGVNGFGNGRLIPAGPLRESPKAGFKRAQAIIVINPSNNTPDLPQPKTVLTASAQPDETAMALKGKKVFAFCGLAYPQKFLDMLKMIGADIAGRKLFADHYFYKDADINALATKAKKHGALLVTTAKDAARLSPHVRGLVTVVSMKLVFNKPEQLDALLDEALK